MKPFLIALLLLMSSGSMVAEETEEIDILRSDIKAQRREIVAEVMGLTESEAERFWPIYREMEMEMDRLHTIRREFIQEYLAVYNHLSNEVAGAIALQHFDHQKKELELRKTYFKKMAKALSPAQAIKFLQIENQIDLYLQVQVASRLPLIN